MVRLKSPLGERRPSNKGRRYIIREELVVERRGEGDAVLVIHKTFYIPQRKLEERRARVGRLEDERAAAAAQAAARIVERAAEVVQEELAVFQEVEAETARAPPPRRHGEDAELLCDVLGALHGCGVLWLRRL